MPRIACLDVPDLAVAAIIRMHPELRDAAIAVTDGRGAYAPVIAASEPARAAGVRDGMTAAQTRLVCDGVVVYPHAPDALRAAGSALADVAASGARIPVVGSVSAGLGSRDVAAGDIAAVFRWLERRGRC